MKKLITFVNRLFSRNSDMPNQYFIVYANPLNSAQTNTIIGKMITKFAPNCKPNSLTVSPGAATVRLQFSSSCMEGGALKNIGEKTIEGVLPVNPVKSISLNGSQIWPSQESLAAKDLLIDVLTDQVVDLTMMSKIELGDDVISEIKRLKDLINEQPR